LKEPKITKAFTCAENDGTPFPMAISERGLIKDRSVVLIWTEEFAELLAVAKRSPKIGESIIGDSELNELRSAKQTLDFMRPEVRAFAQLMERVLRKNDHKTGWKNDTLVALWNRLDDESTELRAIVINEDCDGEARKEDASLAPDIAKEAADIANFAMMIADVCGGLDGIR
jgi:hypothetical protein